MIRVAIFTEGQAELIFTRELLVKFVFEYQDISIECLELHNSDIHKVPYQIKPPDPLFHFQIVDVGTDNKVVSYVGETYQNLIAKKFDLIIGLRDLYSEEYGKLSTVVDEEKIQLFREKQTQTLDRITDNSEKVKLIFAIMEFETWLLSMPHLFEKINPLLTINYIQEKLGYNLLQGFPHRDFYHPTNQVKEIFGLIATKYKKSGDQMESIVARISIEDLSYALSDEKCPSLIEYYTEINNLNKK